MTLRRGSLGSIGRSAALAAALAVLLALLGALAGLAHGRPAQAHAAAVAPPYVAVSGNHLVNASGETIRLLGVDRAGAEYMCLGGQVFDGPVNATAVQAMAAWQINAVRVPLNEDCWLGINGLSPAASGAAYQSAIEGYVQTLQSFGLVVILDLHWAAPGGNVPRGQWPMADAEHAPAFWTSVAKAFSSNHGVVFDLFNEPYITSWSCWRNGCSATYEVSGKRVSYQTAGMQSLVNAVRSTGASQPLMLGGLGWASDETQWLGNEPSDPDHQLAASFHTYSFGGCNSESCWNSTIAPLAAKVPVITGEFGESGCKRTYIKGYMPWADANGVSYLGWTWNATGPPSNWSCSSGPALIENYAGTPTAYGQGLQRHLAKLARKAAGKKARVRGAAGGGALPAPSSG